MSPHPAPATPKLLALNSRAAFLDRLDASSLDRLASGEAAVVWHRGYLDAAVLAPAVLAIRRAAAPAQPAGNEPVSLGAVVGEALGGAEGRDRYLAAAFEQTRVLRDRVFAPYLSPLDRVRLDLDELWANGAGVARIDGRPMSPGTVRIYGVGDRMNPHVDGNAGDVLGDLCRVRRLAVNIYLEVPPPDGGGELELWDLALSPHESARAPDPGFHLSSDALGAPDLVARPAVGDLIVFDTSRIHAVRAVREGGRITASCFVGVRGLDEPLVIFA